MYENIAWNNFLKTGSVESFLEYKKILKANEEFGIIDNIDKNNEFKIGVVDELNKSKGDSNKRDSI